MKPKTIQILSTSLFALLLVWGLYTLIVYLGIPYHGAALLTDESMKAITASCDPTAYMCRGIATLEPFVMHTFERAAPFLWYAIICAVAWAGVAGWQWVKTDHKVVRIVWSPWKIFLLFIASVWLLSTVLSFGLVNGRPETIYPEPTKDTYNVSDHALETLKTDYGKLLDRGCLSLEGDSQAGAKIYTFRAWCIQEAFVTRVLSQVLFVFLFLTELLILGRVALSWIRYRPQNLLHETLFSLGLGASMGIAILWMLAVAGLYTATAGWILALAIPVAAFPHTRYWVEKFLFHRSSREYKWFDISMVLAALLVTYIALNFLEVVRPFPIGWDDLGSYLNRPRLLVSYGRFISSMSPFDWSYLTSLGYLLFGYENAFSATSAMMINWSAGLLALLAVFGFARTFLGDRAGFLSALLYYTLPLVGHFSYADMKIDNAIFFLGAVATLAVMLAVVSDDGNEAVSGERIAASTNRLSLAAYHLFDSPAAKLLIIAGILLGIAFSTKVTAIMVVFPLGALLIGGLFGWRAFLSMSFFICFIYLYRGAVSIQLIGMRIIGEVPPPWLGSVVIGTFFAAGILCLAWSFFYRRPALLQVITFLAALGIGLSLAVLPWAEHNAIESGHFFPEPLGLAPNLLSPKIDIDSLPADLKVDRNNPACSATGSFEELDRYWGFGKGWSHYLTLPWRTVMNLNATGYYVTTIPAFLLFPLLLLLPYFWSKLGRWLRWLFCITGMMLLQWMFLGNGIPWYGIGILLGLVVGLETFVQKAPDLPNRIVVWTLLVCSLMIAFNMRFWQFEQQRNIFEYSMGKVSADALREITIPYYDAISATVVDRHDTMPDQPYLYRIGTFISYFIPRNLEIIGLADHQLDVFNCLYQERDAELTVKRLKYLKFNSMVFDTNTATIESDENGSLHKKVSSFVNFVNDPKSKLQIVVSDTSAGLAFILIP